MPTEATLGAFISLIRPSDELDPKFIYYQLTASSTQATIRSLASTTTNISNVSTSKLAELLFTLAPLPEQHRIVAEIERQFSLLDAGVASLKRVQANLKRYRAAVLQAACTGQLVPTEAATARAEGRPYEPADVLLTRILAERRARWEAEQLAKMEAQGKLPLNGVWKAKYQEPAAPDTNGLPKLPEGWAIGGLEQLTSAVRVICYGILMPKDNIAGGVPYVKVKDMKGDRIDFDGLHRTTVEIASAFARASLIAGDVLLSIRGTYGRVAEVPTELSGGNITQDTARLAVSPLLNSRFLSIHLRSDNTQRHFARVARGVAVKGVNIADVRLTPVLLPPLVEQDRIVEEVERRLSVVDNLEQVVKANLKRAERLRQAVLKEAFAGRLVPQDPDDEPASVLLERIKADRQKENGVSRDTKPRQVRSQKPKLSAATSRSASETDSSSQTSLALEIGGK